MIIGGITLHVLILSAGKILKKPYGGEDLFSRLLATWLAKFRQKVTLMGIEYAGLRIKRISDDNIKHELIANKTKNYNQTHKFKNSYLFYSLRTVFWISQVFRIISIAIMNRISLIHAQDSGYTGLAAIVAGKILHVPVMITLHGIRYDQIESNPYVNKVLKWIELKIEHRIDTFTLNNASIVTIVSPSLKSYVERLAPNSTVISIPVGVKTKEFEFSEVNKRRVREELGIQNHFKIIGYVGRLAYEKNLSNLLHSFADALKQDPFLILVLVGEGALEIELRKQTRDIHIEENVVFCGFRGDVSSILSSFDIFILPSIIEGTSNALLQAMSCGCAIICSDIPGNRELVSNKKDALLVPPNDRAGLKQAILLVLTDMTLRKQLRYNARMTALKYDEEIIFPRYFEYYEKLRATTNRSK